MIASLTRRFALLALLGAALAGCARSEPQQGPVVLAAASLQEALTEAAAAWAAEGHGRPVLSFAGSSALARQIEQGAPADLFVSADEEWMDALAGRKLLREGTRADLLTNSLVVVAPRAAPLAELPLEPAAWTAALGAGRLALADPAGVPAGKYAQAALESLGLWEVVKDRVAPAENVRAALALVDRGVAPLGIVYATDARADPTVKVVATLPATSHPPIRYPAAVLAASRHPQAEDFAAFLRSPPARAIFQRHGFGIAD